MKDKIQKQIAYIESEIADHEKALEQAIAEFRRCANEYDAYNIVNFIPGKLRDIEYQRDKLDRLTDQHRMLLHLMKED